LFFFINVAILFLAFSDMQNKKGTILGATVDYVRQLQKDQSRYIEMSETINELKCSNQRLLEEMQVYVTVLLDLIIINSINGLFVYIYEYI